MPFVKIPSQFKTEVNKVVILGGCGFLGLHITQNLLQHNYQVVIIDSESRLNTTPDNLFPLKCVKTAVNYPYEHPSSIKSVLKPGDILIHLGWSQVPNDRRKNFENDISQNIAFSVSLFELAISTGVSKIVFASSGGSVYGNAGTTPINEKHITEPVSSYGIAKLTTEKYLKLLTRNTSTQYVILRIGNAYGLHLSSKFTPTGLIPFIINAIKNNSFMEIWGDGQAVRDFTYVTDIARAFTASLKTNDLNGTFNIGTGIGTSIKQLIELVEKATGKFAKINYGPARTCDVKEVVLDSSEFEINTHWSPQISLKEGVLKITAVNSQLNAK